MSARLHSAGAVAATLALLLAAPALGAVELPRGEQPRFVWEPPPGGAESYWIEITCNAGARVMHQRSFEPEVTLDVRFCDSLVVRVRAGIGGLAGPYSPPSETLYFVSQDTPSGGAAEPVANASGEPALAADAATTAPTPLDFDGDGRADILVRNEETGTFEIWAVGPDGSEVRAQLPALPLTSRVEGNGDLDGDGSADLLHHDPTTGELGAWLVAGGALVGGGSIDRLSEGWQVAGNGDCDGDGRADVLLHHPDTGSLELWILNGLEREASATLSHPAPGSAPPVATGDYDGDGRADLLWYDRESGALEIWLLDGALVLERVAFQSGFDAGWEIAASGDFDADGTSDVVWRQPVSGETGLWFFADGRLAAQTLLDTRMRPSLRIAASDDLDGDGDADLLAYHPARKRLRAIFLDGSSVTAKQALGALAAPWTLAGVSELRP